MHVDDELMCKGISKSDKTDFIKDFQATVTATI